MMRTLFYSIRRLFSLPKRGRTVRYMFPALVSLMAMMGAAVITSDEASYVRLEVSDTAVAEGQQLSVDVYAYAHVPVNAVDITLQFDSATVEVAGVDTGRSVLTIWTEEPIIKSNQVILRGGTFRKGFLREHLIATIQLKAKQPGQSQLTAADVVLLAGDGKGTPVSVADIEASDANIYVYDESTDPESIGIDIAVNIVTDLDGDGKVSLRDVSAFMAAWGDRTIVYDFNGDNRMTFRDFSIILADWFLK